MTVLAFPLHDPKDVESKFLRKITPFLRQHYSKVYVRLTSETLASNKSCADWFLNDNLFKVSYCETDSQIGEHFIGVYKDVVENSSSNEVVHLCTPDRLAYAVEYFASTLSQDITTAEGAYLPILFTRSQKAWTTHPKNYFALESMLSKEGEVLFNKFLDFAWCHLVLTSADLKRVLPIFNGEGYIFMAQMIMFFYDRLTLKEVDWLSWEDPYILGTDANILKKERESSEDENNKRLSYVIPIMKFLLSYHYKNDSNSVK